MKVKKPNFFRIHITGFSSHLSYHITFPGNTLVTFGDITAKSGMVIKNYKTVRLLSKIFRLRQEVVRLNK